MFYLTLPSNSSMDRKSANNAGHYYTKLPQTIDLSGDYEVGLSEIQFSKSYYNVEKGECWIQFRATETAEQHQVEIPKGLFDTDEHFIYVLNTLIKAAIGRKSSEQGKVKFYYNRKNKRVSIMLYEKRAVVMLSPAVHLLEMEKDTIRGNGHFS